VGEAYSQKLQFSCGNGTYVWTVFEGSLPDGLTLDGNTGVIAGTPRTAGTSEFTIEIIDSLNGFAPEAVVTVALQFDTQQFLAMNMTLHPFHSLCSYGTGCRCGQREFIALIFIEDFGQSKRGADNAL
jgi:hypothetical protein